MRHDAAAYVVKRSVRFKGTVARLGKALRYARARAAKVFACARRAQGTDGNTQRLMRARARDALSRTTLQ